MVNVDAPAHAAIASSTPRDAGFWKRALALLVDVVIVGTTVSLLLLALAAAIPSVGKMVTLNTPFGFGTVERTIESKSTESKDASGNKVTETEKVIERAVLDRWIYRYEVEEKVTEYEGETFVTSVRLSYIWQIDPATGEPIETTEVDHIMLIVLMLYWIIADASRYQGSIGKRVLGLRVVDQYGVRLTLAAAAGRNLFKILSTIPALIGFMMAGWTKRKQALHDWVVGAYVVTAR